MPNIATEASAITNAHGSGDSGPGLRDLLAVAHTEPLLGIASYLPHDNLRVLAQTDPDFILLDWSAEIGRINLRAAGYCVIVRAAPEEIVHALEAGAEGIVVGVKSVEEAERVVALVRGSGGSMDNPYHLSLAPSLAHPSQHAPAILLQLDSPHSAALATQILPLFDGAFAALDALFISLRHLPPDLLESEFELCERLFLTAARECGKPVMWYARSPQAVTRRLEQGYRLLVAGVDVEMLEGAARDAIGAAAAEVEAWREARKWTTEEEMENGDLDQVSESGRAGDELFIPPADTPGRLIPITAIETDAPSRLYAMPEADLAANAGRHEPNADVMPTNREVDQSPYAMWADSSDQGDSDKYNAYASTQAINTAPNGERTRTAREIVLVAPPNSNQTTLDGPRETVHKYHVHRHIHHGHGVEASTETVDITEGPVVERECTCATCAESQREVKATEGPKVVPNTGMGTAQDGVAQNTAAFGAKGVDKYGETVTYGAFGTEYISPLSKSTVNGDRTGPLDPSAQTRASNKPFNITTAAFTRPTTLDSVHHQLTPFLTPILTPLEEGDTPFEDAWEEFEDREKLANLEIPEEQEVLGNRERQGGQVLHPNPLSEFNATKTGREEGGGVISGFRQDGPAPLQQGMTEGARSSHDLGPEAHGLRDNSWDDHLPAKGNEYKSVGHASIDAEGHERLKPRPRSKRSMGYPTETEYDAKHDAKSLERYRKSEERERERERHSRELEREHTRERRMSLHDHDHHHKEHHHGKREKRGSKSSTTKRRNSLGDKLMGLFHHKEKKGPHDDLPPPKQREIDDAVNGLGVERSNGRRGSQAQAYKESVERGRYENSMPTALKTVGRANMVTADVAPAQTATFRAEASKESVERRRYENSTPTALKVPGAANMTGDVAPAQSTDLGKMATERISANEVHSTNARQVDLMWAIDTTQSHPGQGDITSSPVAMTDRRRSLDVRDDHDAERRMDGHRAEVGRRSLDMNVENSPVRRSMMGTIEHKAGTDSVDVVIVDNPPWRGCLDMGLERAAGRRSMDMQSNGRRSMDMDNGVDRSSRRRSMDVGNAGNTAGGRSMDMDDRTTNSTIRRSMDMGSRGNEPVLPNLKMGDTFDNDFDPSSQNIIMASPTPGHLTTTSFNQHMPGAYGTTSEAMPGTYATSDDRDIQLFTATAPMPPRRASPPRTWASVWPTRSRDEGVERGTGWLWGDSPKSKSRGLVDDAHGNSRAETRWGDSTKSRDLGTGQSNGIGNQVDDKLTSNNGQNQFLQPNAYSAPTGETPLDIGEALAATPSKLTSSRAQPRHVREVTCACATCTAARERKASLSTAEAGAASGPGLVLPGRRSIDSQRRSLDSQRRSFESHRNTDSLGRSANGIGSEERAPVTGHNVDHASDADRQRSSQSPRKSSKAKGSKGKGNDVVGHAGHHLRNKEHVHHDHTHDHDHLHTHTHRRKSKHAHEHDHDHHLSHHRNHSDSISHEHNHDHKYPHAHLGHRHKDPQVEELKREGWSAAEPVPVHAPIYSVANPTLTPDLGPKDIALQFREADRLQRPGLVQQCSTEHVQKSRKAFGLRAFGAGHGHTGGVF